MQVIGWNNFYCTHTKKIPFAQVIFLSGCGAPFAFPKRHKNFYNELSFILTTRQLKLFSSVPFQVCVSESKGGNKGREN